LRQFGAAHEGYLHQDVLAACALARLHLAGNTDTVVFNDVKDHAGDRFDDLTIRGTNDRRQQIKWHQDGERLLTLADLLTKNIRFPIDEVLDSFLSNRTRASEYRLVTTCAGPAADLSLYLVEDPYVPASSAGLPTRRFRISARAVWPEEGRPLWEALARFDRQTFTSFCDVFVIEIGCPRCSLNLRAPGELEQHLLTLLEHGIGIGRFPNTSLTPADAAAHLIYVATAARLDKRPRGREDVREALDLQTDFGRVPEHLPVDMARLVSTPDAIEQLVEHTTSTQVVVVQGVPGSGKSWLLEELRKHLLACGQLAVAHYCFVELGDQDQDRRSTANVVFGSLIAELHDLDGGLIAETVPRYAAGPRELECVLAKAVNDWPDRRITLIVDGLDHADRLTRPGARLALDLAQELAELDLPDGVRLIIGSQAGDHLEPLRPFAAVTEVRHWDDDHIRALAMKAGLQDNGVLTAYAADIGDVLDAISEKARGNPLYATYLSRTVLGVAAGDIKLRSEASVVEYLLRAPEFDEGLSSYYQWLFDAATTDHGAEAVVRALALAGLPLTAAELAEIFPMVGTIIPKVLSLLSPVLLGDSVRDEVRIYHESFQRFVAARADNVPGRAATLAPVIDWLQTRGFFSDLRAFRWLIPILRNAGRDTEIIVLCCPDFVTSAVACGQPGDAVMANLAIAAQAARELDALPDLVRVVELNRAADFVYHWALDDDDLAPLYGRAFVALHGATALSHRLLHDGRRTFHPRVGIMFCHLCDQAGAAPPWQPHLGALQRFRTTSNITYTGGEPNVNAARVAGELQLAGPARAPHLVLSWLSDGGGSGVHPLRLAEIYAWVFGTQALLDVIEQLTPGSGRGWARLAAARSCDDPAVAVRLASEAVDGDLDDPAAIRVALQIGPAPAELQVRRDVDQLTAKVNSEHGYLRTTETLAEWIAELDIAVALGDHTSLHRTESLIEGPGWYRRWLRFAVRLRLRPHPADVLDELRALSTNIDLYRGTPTVNQLYFAYDEIELSFREAMALMDDEHFPAAAEALFTLSDNVTPNPAVRFGPLVLDDVLQVLLSTSDTTAKCTAASRLSATRLAPDSQVGGVYNTHATNQFLLSRLHARAGMADLARDAWQQGCIYLGAYGHRKDLTVFEISDALPALGAADPARVTACIAAAQPLVEAVIAHTDLKGTEHALSSWAHDAATLHPAGGLLHIATRALAGVTSPVNLDRAMAAGFAALRGVVTDEVLQACWVALGQVAIAEADAALRTCEVPTTHSHEAWQLVQTSLLDNNSSTLTQEVVDLVEQSAARMGQLVPTVRTWGRRVEDLTNSRREPAEDAPISSAFVIETNASAAQIAHAVQRWRTARRTADIGSVVAAVLAKLVEIDARDGAEASWLLNRIGTDSFIFSDDLLLSGLADGLEQRGKSRLAAMVLTLIYTRTIDGWRRFAGSKEHFLRAVALDENEAWTTLIREIADSVRPGVEFGSTVHLLELLTASGRSDDAYACWEEARRVIAHRLPPIGPTDATVVPYDSTADDVLASTAACLVARLHDEAGREAALDGVRILMGQYNDEALQVVAHMIAIAHQHVSPHLVDDLLGVIEEFDVAPFKVTQKAAEPLSAVAAGNVDPIADRAQRLLDRAEAR
jgi:hypothetical protein